MSSKEFVTCSYCAKIYKDPIILPCDDSICAHHLCEPKVLNENSIKCMECNLKFEIEGNQFKPNKHLRKYLKFEMYLTHEEKSLKQKLEANPRLLQTAWNYFSANRLILNLKFVNHFAEQRRQIDLHKESLKQKIDDIYTKIIKETEDLWAAFKNKYHMNCDELTFRQDLKETFRDPNLLIYNIKQLVAEQEEIIAKVKSKTDEMIEIIEDLKLHEFKPFLSFDQSYFGQLALSKHSASDCFKSEILTETQSIEIIKLCEFSLSDKWTLLYRGSRDGFRGQNFHSKCDDHSPTFTILKAQESLNIFGGYTEAKWSSPSTECSKSDSKAFIFSLTNKENKPCKIKTKNASQSIWCDPSSGPSFSSDIYIADRADKAANSHSFLGTTYGHAQYAKGSREAKLFLAGGQNFKLDEIEVYKKETNF
jgi:hypothetical protein